MGVVLLAAGFWALGWVMGVPVARRLWGLPGLWLAAIAVHLTLPEGHGLRVLAGGDAQVWAVVGGLAALGAGYVLGLRRLRARVKPVEPSWTAMPATSCCAKSGGRGSSGLSLHAFWWWGQGA